MVLGVFPGVESTQSQIIYQEAVTREGAANKPVSTQVDRVVGQPTTVPSARGVMVGTLVNRTNNDLSHVCDISPEVKKTVIWIRAQFGYVVEAIRKAIRALLKAIGLDPSGESSKLVQTLKSLARELKKYKKYVDDFNKSALELVRLAAQLRAMIDYILSLPEKYLKLLQDCLVKIYAALAGGFTDLLASPDNLLGADVNMDEFNTPVVNDIEAEAKANLKGSVGGVQGILEIQKSVSEGITDYSAAVGILDLIYGISLENARRILGTPRITKPTA